MGASFRSHTPHPLQEQLLLVQVQPWAPVQVQEDPQPQPILILEREVRLEFTIYSMDEYGKCLSKKKVKKCEKSLYKMK